MRIFAQDKFHSDSSSRIDSKTLSYLYEGVVVPYFNTFVKTYNRNGKPAIIQEYHKYLTMGRFVMNPCYVDLNTYQWYMDGYVGYQNDTWGSEGNYYFMAFCDWFGLNYITIDPNVLIKVGNTIFKPSKTTLSASDLDTGTAFVLGNDYYVYICDPSNGDDWEDVDEVYKISLNSTCPDGWNESNSRKIGGFHYGHIRKVSPLMVPVSPGTSKNTLVGDFEGDIFNSYMGTSMDTLMGNYMNPYGTNWISNVVTGIIPNSVWTLLHRPQCSPEGMVYLGGNLWGDIYLASDDGNYGLQSKRNMTPATGTTGGNLNWYGFIERAANVGKRLPSYAECIRAAAGSPPGANNNTNARTQGNNSASAKTGTIANATSAYNVKDLVGNVWKWCLDIFQVQSNTQTESQWNNANASLKLGGLSTVNDCGDIYGPAANSYKCIKFGGTWNTSTNAGRRCANISNSPYELAANTGAWLVCESKKLPKH